MLENIMFIISFISLYLSVFWLNIHYIEKHDIKKTYILTKKPMITFLLPAYNEEKTITRTIQSIINVNYPKNLFEIIIIDDGSKDKTASIVKDLIKQYTNIKIKLLQQKNNGKASALNNGMTKATGEYIAIVDADSRIEPNSIKYLIPHLYEKDVGAVISCIKIENPKTIVERLQNIEYLISTLFRRLFSSLGTLFVTPGVLSLYKKEALDTVGKFDEGNLTEDFEIAMRLQYNGYNIKSEINSITYTKAPNTFKALAKQRIRWNRGFIYNTLKYKDMLIGNKFNILVRFQISLSVIGALMLMLGSAIVTYGVLDKIYTYIIKAITIKSLPRLYDIPKLNEFILSMNIKLMIPLILLTIIGLYFIKKAHNYTDEKMKISPILFMYIIIYPLLLAKYWIIGFIQEYRNAKKEW
ncbi:MAG: glycosyltransferase [DPANN group archaeon]|nr:glycosyltransferase [DPANN group archaeon]